MRRPLIPLLLVVVAASAQACGSESTDRVADPGPAQETAPADCQALIPDSALDLLGWDAESAVTLDSGTCERAAAQGEVAVRRRAVAAVGESDLPEQAERAYAERCGELDAVPDPDDPSAPPSAGEETDWLSGDIPVCVVTADGDRGENVLLVLTDNDALVEIRVDVNEPTAADAVQAGLTELAWVAVDRL